MYSIDVRNLSKSFKVRTGVPIYSGLGPGHWLTSLLFKGSSKEQFFQAVDNLSLQIKPGEFVGLLGPNGAGKTTLLKCISTLLIPESGDITVCGYDVQREIDQVKRSISLVGSGSWIGFDWGLTVFENLLFFASLYGLKSSFAKKKVGHVLELVGLSGMADSVPRTLSAGQRQKMALAKGFLLHAPVFLLDEPTVALDPVSAYEVKKYIREELSQKGVTIILTTHHLMEAEELCSRVVLMNKGQVIADDSVANLRGQVSDSHIFELETSDIPAAIMDELRLLPGVISLSLTRGSIESMSCIIRASLADQQASEKIVSLLNHRHITLKGYGFVEPSLEDVFVKLTGRGLANGAA